MYESDVFFLMGSKVFPGKSGKGLGKKGREGKERNRKERKEGSQTRVTPSKSCGELQDGVHHTWELPQSGQRS